MQDDTCSGFARARPIRVAFLITDGEHAHLALDAIFAEAMSRWGGRYSLICPCNNGAPRQTYSPWLRAFDPDVIYSYIDLTEAALLRLREDLGPAYLVRHSEPLEGISDPHDFRVALPIRSLSSLSTTLQYSKAFPASAPQPVRVVDYLPGQAHDRFIDDNFGTFYGSAGIWPIPINLSDSVTPIAVASQDLLAQPSVFRIRAEETVLNATELLRFMSEHRNVYGLAQFAADSTPRIELRDVGHDAFTLVVGETFADRIAFWNRRSRDPVHFGREVCSLIVPPERLDDPSFFGALVKFLATRNGVFSNSGPQRVALCSVSQTAEHLSVLQERLQTADRGNLYTVNPSFGLDEVVPAPSIFEHGRHLVAGGMLGRRPEWKEFLVSKATRPPLVLPEHLAQVQVENFATSGSWGIDVTIERQENHSRYSHGRHDWFFPRRLRLHQAFLPYYEHTKSGRELRHTRANGHGALTLFAGLGEEVPSIEIPTDEAAFRYALQRGDAWSPFRRADYLRPPRLGPFGWSAPSDKGRYLIGTLRMFGGVQNAGNVLLHKFWRSAFEDLGAALSETRREEIKATIRKKIRTVTTGPAEWDEPTWQRLTSVVASEAYQVRVPLRALSYEELEKRHQAFLAKEAEELRSDATEDAGDWMEYAKATLRKSVQDRCARRVLFQGHQWRCRTCFATNWNDIASMGLQLHCEICGATERAPVNEPWSFRLNGFLQDAIREHGVLALVWCLVQLESSARSSFFYLGPHNLWIEGPGNETAGHDNEADLICVVDGRVHLCEVKSSAREIVFDSLVEVANRIRPDVVTLAVMEPTSGRLVAKRDELRTLLSNPAIDVELLTFFPDEMYESARIP